MWHDVLSSLCKPPENLCLKCLKSNILRFLHVSGYNTNRQTNKKKKKRVKAAEIKKRSRCCGLKCRGADVSLALNVHVTVPFKLRRMLMYLFLMFLIKRYEWWDMKPNSCCWICWCVNVAFWTFGSCRQSLAATFSRFLFCVEETGWLRVFSYFFLFWCAF